MMDLELRRRVERCRADFEAETGKPFDHFFCPILHLDEPAAHCRGHIVPDALGAQGGWVPQRADVDNFYGSVAEALFVSIVKDQGKDPAEVWLDPVLRRRHLPRLEFDGMAIDHYFTDSAKPVPGQTLLQVQGNDGRHFCNVVVKKSLEEMLSLSGKSLQLVVERDYRPAVVASVIKAAHLTLFKMLGYRYVFSSTGLFLADTLRRFFRSKKAMRAKARAEHLEACFAPLSRMVSPMIVRDGSLQGTVVDNRMLTCIGSTQGVFCLCVVVRARNDMFCVFLPAGDAQTVGTYFGFLNEPPKSVAVKLIQFCPANGDNEARWETGNDEPIRIELPETLSESTHR